MKRDTRTLYLLVIILILVIVFILIFTIPKNYVIISISTHNPWSELSTGLELRPSPIMPASYTFENILKEFQLCRFSLDIFFQRMGIMSGVLESI